MITPKEIEQKTMSPEKRKSAKNDYFAFYVGRPLSYILTIPFLYTNITPNTVCFNVFCKFYRDDDIRMGLFFSMESLGWSGW